MVLVNFGDLITKIYQSPHGTPEENGSRNLSFEGLGLERTFAPSYSKSLKHALRAQDNTLIVRQYMHLISILSSVD